MRLAVEQLGAKPIAVLPYPPGQYWNALPDDESREEFSALLGLAGSSVDISSLMRSRLGEAAYGAADNLGMAERFAAAFIAEHSEVLFAVSGDSNTREPDTSALIVKWMREGGITREYSLRVNKSGLDTMDRRMIITVDPAGSGVSVEYTPPDEAAPRGIGGPQKPDGIPAVIYTAVSRRIFGLIQSASGLLDNLYDSFFKRAGPEVTDRYPSSPFIGIMERIDGFNLDIRKYLDLRGEKDFLKSRHYLLQDESDNERISGDPALRKIICLYTGSDVLSQFYQKKTAGLVNWIYVLFFVAVVLYGLIDWSSYLVLCYIGLIPSIALLVKTTSRDRVEDRFLDYRALAEGLRVQFFWTLSGI
ncbi:MAG TPA: hypothetical protein VJV40_01720, partial [Thermodesulfobacteriota bacterium]|nr:hypothetical protein [Thermodesulfobacteriota bacterium]